MKKGMRVAIVGSGATGLAAARAAIRNGQSVDLIDPKFDIFSNTPSKTEERLTSATIAKKSKFGSFKMYQYPSDILLNEKQLDLPISSSFGGLTAVWGSNLWLPTVEELGLPQEVSTEYKASEKNVLKLLKILGPASKKDEFQSEIYESVPQSVRIRELIEKSETENNSFYFGSSILAVDAKLCIKCGKCLTGCPTNAIFSADIEWSELINSGQVNLVKGLATGINPHNSISIRDSDIDSETISYSRIFLACGAIATANLLQKSKLIPSQVYLNDTQVFYAPIFNYRKTPKHDVDFTLAQAFFRSFDLRDGIHLSIYESSEEVKSRAKRKLGIFSYIVPNFLWRFVLAGIGFFPPEMSGRIKIDRGEIQIEENLDTKKFRKHSLKRELLKLRSIGMFTPPFGLQIPSVGSSYHVGTVQMKDGTRIFDLSGRVPNRDNVFVVDSGSLPRIPTGPITLCAMVNADRIVTSSLNSLSIL